MKIRGVACVLLAPPRTSGRDDLHGANKNLHPDSTLLVVARGVAVFTLPMPARRTERVCRSAPSSSYPRPVVPPSRARPARPRRAPRGARGGTRPPPRRGAGGQAVSLCASHPPNRGLASALPRRRGARALRRRRRSARARVASPAVRRRAMTALNRTVAGWPAASGWTGVFGAPVRAGALPRATAGDAGCRGRSRPESGMRKGISPSWAAGYNAS
jgi:hypothetical protein